MLKNQSLFARNTFHIILKAKSKSDSRRDVISNFCSAPYECIGMETTRSRVEEMKFSHISEVVDIVFLLYIEEISSG